MFDVDYTKELTELQGIIIENIERTDSLITIYIKMERKLTKCPCCGELTDTIHDYKTQIVKDLPAFCNNVILSLKKRRYRLKENFYKILDCEDRETAKEKMSEWVLATQNIGIIEYEKCASTMIDWQRGIQQSY